MHVSKTFLQTDSKTLQWIQYIVLISVILYFGRDIFIPISFALLISFVLYPICRWMEAKGVGRLTAIVISLSLLIVLGLLIVTLLVSQFVAFAHEWPHLQAKLDHSFGELSGYLRDVFNITKDQQAKIVAKITDNSGKDVLQVVKGTISASPFLQLFCN